MSQYPEFRATRTSWGIDVLGTLVVDVETRDGIVEQHLARFVVGKTPWDIETIWDQMYRSTLFCGRKGLVLNAISAVDLALWDALGRIRQEPVYAMIGGAVREALTFYATGPRPDLGGMMKLIPILQRKMTDPSRIDYHLNSRKGRCSQWLIPHSRSKSFVTSF